MSTQRRHWISAPRFSPLLGVVIGAAGGAVYWLGAQLWPTSIAVVLSMLATAVMPGGALENAVPRQPTGEITGADRVRGFGTVGFVFGLLLKYSTLMALSAASLPFAVPANVALGLIMICGHAASRALAVSLTVGPDHDSPQPGGPSTPISNGDLVFALAVGFAPAALLGIPGLIGLAVAVLARVAFGAYLKHNRKTIVNAAFYATQQLTEVCFYLAALASWPFV
jgi:adenosylcobinamide-GDP ribazoletransferase